MNRKDWEPRRPRAIESVFPQTQVQLCIVHLRKVTKARGSFPNDEAVSKLLFLALRNIAKKWTKPLVGWKDALNRFAIIYENRLPAN